MLVNWWLEWCEGGCGGGGSLSLPLSSSSAALRSRIPAAPTSRIASLMEVRWRKRRQTVRELTFHTATPNTCRYGHMESYLIPIDLSPECNLLILISLISLACLLKLRFHINRKTTEKRKLSTQDGFMLNSIRLQIKMSFKKKYSDILFFFKSQWTGQNQWKTFEFIDITNAKSTVLFHFTIKPGNCASKWMMVSAADNRMNIVISGPCGSPPRRGYLTISSFICSLHFFTPELLKTS